MRGDEKMRRLYERRRLQLQLEATELADSYQRGLEKGIERGIEKGIEEECRVAARRMLARGMAAAEVAEILELALEEVRSLAP